MNKKANRRKGKNGKRKKHRVDRKPVRPIVARQLVALWADCRLKRGDACPYRFASFCHDVEVFVGRPIGRGRAHNAWSAVLKKLGRPQTAGSGAGELSERDIVRLLALEKASKWAAAMKLNILSEAACLTAAHLLSDELPFYEASKDNKQESSILDECAAAFEAELGGGNAPTSNDA